MTINYLLKQVNLTDIEGIDWRPSLHQEQLEKYKAIMLSLEYAVIEQVPGHLAEFGVQMGQEAMVTGFLLRSLETNMEAYLKRLGAVPKNLHLFDSFQGYPEITNAVDTSSFEVKRNYWYEGLGGLAGTPPDKLAEMASGSARHYLGDHRVETHVGFFEDTLARLPDGLKLAFVSIDCDLYESTVQVLDHLFGHDILSDGAVVLFGGGWNHNRASPDFGYRRAWRECVARHNVAVSDGGAVGAMARRFFVHRQE